METQTNLYGHEVELGYLPKKDCVIEARKVRIDNIIKADYGFVAHVYAGFCGNRQLYISNTQYTMLKNASATDFWIKAEEKGINKKNKGRMEYTAKISVDKETWV